MATSLREVCALLSPSSCTITTILAVKNLSLILELIVPMTTYSPIQTVTHNWREALAYENKCATRWILSVKRIQSELKSALLPYRSGQSQSRLVQNAMPHTQQVFLSRLMPMTNKSINQTVMFSSVLQPSSIRRLATPWTYFLHLSLSSVILIDSYMGSPVHVLMLSIQACVVFLVCSLSNDTKLPISVILKVTFAVWNRCNSHASGNIPCVN